MHNRCRACNNNNNNASIVWTSQEVGLINIFHLHFSCWRAFPLYVIFPDFSLFIHYCRHCFESSFSGKWNTCPGNKTSQRNESVAIGRFVCWPISIFAKYVNRSWSLSCHCTRGCRRHYGSDKKRPPTMTRVSRLCIRRPTFLHRADFVSKACVNFLKILLLYSMSFRDVRNHYAIHLHKLIYSSFPPVSIPINMNWEC